MSLPSRIRARIRARIPLALALAGLALGACTARDTARVPAAGPRYASLDATLDGAPAAAAARSATPMALLPDWAGRPRRLRERDDSAAFEQVVSLGPAPRAEPGDNRIVLRLFRARPATGGDALDARPSEAGIRAELAAGFAGIAMQVVTRPAANAYGPYGLAVGRTARGTRCLYAWQWIEAAPDLAAGARGPLALRVRLCRDDITLDAMAAAMDGLRLVPRFEGTPLAAVSSGRPAAPRRHVAAGSARAVPEARPPGGARAEAGAGGVAAGWAGPAPGRRYLGVAGTADASPTPGDAPAPSPAAGEAPAAMRADLPPEALRGPAARAGARP